MPLTAYTTLLGSIIMIGAWTLIGQRMRRNPEAATRQLHLLHGFFLMMGLFFLFMFAPHLTLLSTASHFPLYMAWGYVIGHVFMYLGLTNIARLTVSMVPRLVNKDRLILIICRVLTVAITALNLKTMVFGTQPAFDAERSVTLFNAAPAVGASIALFAAATVLPAAILMIVNGVHNPNARLRSFLLGSGLFVLMTAGPIHDNARTAQLYVIADIVSMISLILIAGGILYRFEERLSLSKANERQQ